MIFCTIAFKEFWQRTSSKVPFQARNVDISHDEGLQFDGQPLYAKVAVDFDTVARIILGAEILQPTRLVHLPTFERREVFMC